MAEINDMDLFKVDGLVAVITGGGTGLGLMMAKALAANGANKVYIVGRRLEKLEEAAKASPHGNIIPAQGDASSKESLGALAERVKKEVGYINLLVCNSGRSGPSVQAFPPDLSLSQIKERMWEWEFEDFNDVFKLNNTGTFFTAVAFLDLLDAGNKKGNRAGIDSQIVITASLAGLMRTLATGVAYGASKAAAVHMTKVLSTYFAPHGIRVNAICPGIFPSEMTQGHVGGSASFGVNTIPAGRVGSDEDMRGTILWLASRAGAYINGMIVVLDGGRLSTQPAVY